MSEEGIISEHILPNGIKILHKHRPGAIAHIALMVNTGMRDELDNEKLNDCAVITTPLVIDGKKIASIGVIGPERIDYGSIASALKIIADEINEKRSNKDKGGG